MMPVTLRHVGRAKDRVHSRSGIKPCDMHRSQLLPDCPVSMKHRWMKESLKRILELMPVSEMPYLSFKSLRCHRPD